jgi:hypothetical protein
MLHGQVRLLQELLVSEQHKKISAVRLELLYQDESHQFNDSRNLGNAVS